MEKVFPYLPSTIHWIILPPIQTKILSQQFHPQQTRISWCIIIFLCIKYNDVDNIFREYFLYVIHLTSSSLQFLFHSLSNPIDLRLNPPHSINVQYLIDECFPFDCKWTLNMRNIFLFFFHFMQFRMKIFFYIHIHLIMTKSRSLFHSFE